MSGYIFGATSEAMEDEFSDLAEEDRPARNGNGFLWCKICDFKCLGPGEYFRHVAGVKHQQKKRDAEIRKQPLLTPKEEVVSPPPSITSYIQDWGRTRPTKRPLVSEPNIQPHSSSLSTGIGVTRSPSIEMGPRVHPKVVLPRRRENTSTSLFPGESPAKGSWQPDNSKSLVPARWHGNQSASTSLFPKESAAKGSWQSDNSTSLVPARWHGNQSTATPSSPSNITVNISCNSFTMSSFAAQARTANMGNFPLAVDTRLFSDAGRGYREQSDAQPPLAIEPKPIPRPAPQMPVQPVVQQTVQPVAQQNAPNEFRRRRRGKKKKGGAQQTGGPENKGGPQQIRGPERKGGAQNVSTVKKPVNMNEAILEISSMLSVLYLSDLASVATPAAKPCDMVEPNFGSVLGMFQPIGAPCLLPTLRPRGMKLPERDYRNVVKPANFSLPPRFLALPGSATHKEPPHHLFGFYVFKFQERLSSREYQPIKRTRTFGDLEETEQFDGRKEKDNSHEARPHEPQRKVPRTISPTQRPRGILKKHSPLPKQIPFIELSPTKPASQGRSTRSPSPPHLLPKRRPLPKQIPYIKPRFLTEVPNKNKLSSNVEGYNRSPPTPHEPLEDKYSETEVRDRSITPDGSRHSRESYSSYDVHKDRDSERVDRSRDDGLDVLRDKRYERPGHYGSEPTDSYYETRDRRLHSEPEPDRDSRSIDDDHGVLRDKRYERPRHYGSEPRDSYYETQDRRLHSEPEPDRDSRNRDDGYGLLRDKHYERPGHYGSEPRDSNYETRDRRLHSEPEPPKEGYTDRSNRYPYDSHKNPVHQRDSPGRREDQRQYSEHNISSHPEREWRQEFHAKDVHYSRVQEGDREGRQATSSHRSRAVQPAKQICSPQVIKTLDKLVGISSSLQPVRDVILDKLRDGTLTEKHLPKIFEELVVILQSPLKPSADSIMHKLHELIRRTVESTPSTTSVTEVTRAQTQAREDRYQSFKSHNQDIRPSNVQERSQEARGPTSRQKSREDPGRSPPYLYDDPHDRIYESSSDPYEARFGSQSQAAAPVPQKVTTVHTGAVAPFKKNANSNWEVVPSASTSNTPVTSQPRTGTTSQRPLENYKGKSTRKRDRKVIYLKGKNLSGVEHKIWKLVVGALSIDMRHEYKAKKYKKESEAYITFGTEKDAAASLTILRGNRMGGAWVKVEFMYADDRDFKEIRENMFSEDSDMMVVAISGTGLGCRLKKLRSFLPYVNDLYVPKQFQTAEYKNSMVTAYATFEFQSDASLTFYKLQGAQFCGEKLHAVYAKKGELNRVMSEDFWAPGQSKSKAKPPDVFTPKKKSPKPSPSGKSKRSQQIPLENYLNKDNETRRRNWKRLLVQGYKIGDDISRRYIHNMSEGNPLVLMREEYAKDAHAHGWVQVYLCFDHKEHAEASLSSLKSTQVKSMPLEVQYMYEDDADFEEVKAELWKNFNSDATILDLHSTTGSSTIYQLRHLIRTSYYLMMINEEDPPNGVWCGRAYFRYSMARAASEMSLALPDGTPVYVSVAKHPIMDNNKGLLADMAHQMMKTGQIIHVGQNRDQLIVRSLDNRIVPINTNLDLLDLMR